MRDGAVLSVPAHAVVPGDLLLLASGDRVAADARVISSSGLEVDEAALTGESVPVAKAPDAPTAAGRIVLAGQDIEVWSVYLEASASPTARFAGFLTQSETEQADRFRKRLEKPEKNWKFRAADLAERKHWDEYQVAYEAALTKTSTDVAPWYVVPADHKWYRNVAISAIIVDLMQSLKLTEIVTFDREFNRVPGIIRQEP